MRVFSLVSQKGGAGKSTLACHFAAIAGEAGPAYLIDRDPQATTGKWWDRRAAIEPAPQRPELIDLDGQALETAVAGLKKRDGTVFIDTRPAVQEPEAEAARAADLVVVPVRPSINDLEAVRDTLAILKRLKRPAAIVVNASRNKVRAQEARAALSEYGVPVCPHHLTDRTAYQDAALEGLTVMELRGQAAESAAEEIRKVWTWIEGVA